MNTRIIAITGGIGAGKSVVSRILTTLGFRVYDCDSRAKVLMDNSSEIKRRIAEEIASEAVVDDEIRRDVLASVVFSDAEKLRILNSIVHHHVRCDIAETAASCGVPVLFIETAILYESGLDKVWDVTAPEDIRVERIINRNHCKAEQARARIESQRIIVTDPHPAVHTIINDNLTPLLPQILRRLAEI